MLKSWMAFVGIALVATAGAVENPVLTHLPPNVPPALGCWFWHEEDFKDQNYRAYIDIVAKHAKFTLLTASLRIPQGELTDAFVHDTLREAMEYAARFDIRVALDLDVRLTREAFQTAYPDEMQEMLRIRETPRNGEGDTVLEITSETLSDHYTGRAKPYLPLASRLMRVYAFARSEGSIAPGTVVDITSACRIEERSEKKIRIAAPKTATDQPIVCACVAFSHLTPDVYAPHLLEFQRELLRRYADVKLVGACKDEWGFPPCFDGTPKHNDFWYSEPMALAYNQRTGRDLVRDCLLMYAGEVGREGDRQGAVNHFMEMNRLRNVEIEGDFYRAVKEVFGQEAMVSTHPTWYPYCDSREFKKNGLDWWAARRDYAQTDEVTPFCVRTAMAKKWNNSVWYNMFYAPEKSQYETAVWSHALAGGRINYHPLYPLKEAPGWRMSQLFAGNLMRGEARIRMLHFIQPAPLDCRIAVIFGHPCAMNWAGPAYEDVGKDVADALWRAGYYTDLIPTSEIESGAVKIENGKIAYGTQRYDWVVLYHPEFERSSIAEFFRNAADGKTALNRVGDWTRDFDGKPFDGNATLPDKMIPYPDGAACLAALLEVLPRSVQAGTPAVDAVCWNTKLVQPPAAGHCRLVDGTRLVLAGQNDPAGDPILTTLDIDGHTVAFDAVGVAAVRLAADGSVNAMAAGNLKRFESGSMKIELQEPCDIALWRDASGNYHGALQGLQGAIPPALISLTADWVRLDAPTPLPE
ncbi:MAG TPA: hypothetical protein PLI09_04305 [Candidatus Hydrogenedentes bacterium]|nr:hypothetical protein [Candidatus Hydrogenedentota bacterium]